MGAKQGIKDDDTVFPCKIALKASRIHIEIAMILLSARTELYTWWRIQHNDDDHAGLVGDSYCTLFA